MDSIIKVCVPRGIWLEFRNIHHVMDLLKQYSLLKEGVGSRFADVVYISIWSANMNISIDVYISSKQGACTVSLMGKDVSMGYTLYAPDRFVDKSEYKSSLLAAENGEAMLLCNERVVPVDKVIEDVLTFCVDGFLGGDFVFDEDGDKADLWFDVGDFTFERFEPEGRYVISDECRSEMLLEFLSEDSFDEVEFLSWYFEVERY